MNASTQSTRPQARPTLLVLTILCSQPLAAWAWTGTMPDGSALSVDPDSHRATRIDGDDSIPMWDGVHRMSDGSVVIIRDGTAVPNQDMLDAWESAAGSEEDQTGRPCDQLVRMVCGWDGTCATSAACLSARSLQNAEREAQRRAPFDAGPRPETPEADQCRAALADAGLSPCTSPTDQAQSPCGKLVDLVCGSDGRCATSPACAPARQLQAQESRERAQTSQPGASTPSGGQCREAMGNDFFAPCSP